MEETKNKNRNKKKIQKSPIKKEKSPSPYRAKTIENDYPDAFPKNANEFRHIIEDIKCCRADVEFMLELRRHKKIENLEKISGGSEPTFYHDDLTKYKGRITLKPEEKKMLQINIGQYKYILSDRSRYAINYPTFKYETKLRTEPSYLSKSVDKIKKSEINKENDNKNKKNQIFDIKKWDSSYFPKNGDLFNTLLPPILPRSKEVFSKNEKRVGRPIIIKKKESFLNGVKIKGRIFDYNSSLAFRYPSDHLPNSKYINDYGVGNLGEISHLLKSDNKTMTNNWYSYLRGLKKKSVSPDDIKRTEKKLKEKSNQKSNIHI